MINRAALILKYKEPAITWLNEADPYNDNPGITKKDVNSDRQVYLIADEVADHPEILEEWLQLNVDILFESELESWYNDPSLWPENRDYAQFKKWFKVECHTILVDTVPAPIEDDDDEVE